MAERIGQPSPKRMMKQISVSEWIDWYKHYEANPWGSEVDNFRTGQICAAVMNSSGRFKKTFKPADFVPGKSKAQTAEDQKSIMKSLMARHG